MKRMIYVLMMIVLIASVTALGTGAKAEDPYPMCDMNGDGVRNLVDVSKFAQVKDTMDVNGDGVHNLVDVSLFAQNKDVDGWCAKTFNPPVKKRSALENVFRSKNVFSRFWGFFK